MQQMREDENYRELYQDLEEFSETWSIEGPIICCQDCGLSQSVDQAAGPFVHGKGCIKVGLPNALHPWHELAAQLRKLPKLR